MPSGFDRAHVIDWGSRRIGLLSEREDTWVRPYPPQDPPYVQGESELHGYRYAYEHTWRRRTTSGRLF